VFSLPAVLPGWDKDKEYVNFDATPKKFGSKGELSKYCKERKVSSAALL
jgi:hypothetical protein